MGVRWLVKWRSHSTPDDVSRGTDEEQLASILDQLGCKSPKDPKTAKMELKCHLLKQATGQAQAANLAGQPQVMRDLWLVQSTDAADTCFLVDRQQHEVLEADNGMLVLVEKKLDYRIKTCVTLSGKRYHKGDFGVRLLSGHNTITGAAGAMSMLGYVIELEYLPVSSMEVASGMLSAFLELLRAQIPRTASGVPVGSLDFSGNHSHLPERFKSYKNLGDTFTTQHAAVLYVDVSLDLLLARSQQARATQQQQQPGLHAATPQAPTPVVPVR